MSSGGVTAAAYDPLHKWWFMVFGNSLFKFPELETGTMVVEGHTGVQGYDIQGMIWLNSTANDTIDLRFYLGKEAWALSVLLAYFPRTFHAILVGILPPKYFYPLKYVELDKL
jgi:hypothetical protein